MDQCSAIEEAQRDVCKRFSEKFCAAPRQLKLGIVLNVRDGIFAINGLRHALEGETSGWYIWAGEEGWRLNGSTPGLIGPIGFQVVSPDPSQEAA